ncbi:hypothetical protein [Breznakibacter xylanolyticus]|uniref:hypothetical protein n=1 Tax=Breznakibacter xylanolyticus TaxID=990 RepID=UPI0014744B9B|nr:hypothetical protein [Breznakibacter xylanolyticus]
MMKSHGGTVAGAWPIHQSTRVDASDIVSNNPLRTHRWGGVSRWQGRIGWR